MTEPERVLLFNQEAEKAIIGSVLIDPGLLDELDITSDDFYVHRNHAIYEAAYGLWRKQITPDLVTLVDLFDRRGDLEDIGGAAYLTDCITQTVSVYNAGSYAVTIRDYARRRRVVNIAGDLARAAYAVGANMQATITQSIDALAGAAQSSTGAAHMAQFMAQLQDEVHERIRDPQAIWGIPTGFTDLDKYLGGLQLGEVFYLAGEPGIGKSKLMANIAANMATAGYPGVIYSLEMGGLAMAMRAASAWARVPTRLLKTGKLDQQQVVAFDDAISELSEAPWYMRDSGQLTIPELRADLARLKAQAGVQWFALDYLMLLSGYDDLGETERSAHLSRGIKQIAHDLSLAALTVNSVTKDAMGDGNTPTQKQLRGSGQVIHDADLIAFIVPDEMNKDTMIKLVFTKQREVSGGKRKITLFAHQDYPRFENTETKPIEPGGNGRK